MLRSPFLHLCRRLPPGRLVRCCDVDGRDRNRLFRHLDIHLRFVDGRLFRPDVHRPRFHVVLGQLTAFDLKINVRQGGHPRLDNVNHISNAHGIRAGGDDRNDGRCRFSLVLLRSLSQRRTLYPVAWWSHKKGARTFRAARLSNRFVEIELSVCCRLIATA